MEILEILREYAQSDKIAMINIDEKLIYRQLWEESDALAAYIKEICADKTPIVVYGHKHPKMLVAFLACVKSGHAYVPIDINVPPSRVQAIIDTVQPPLILKTEELEINCACPVFDVIKDSFDSNTEIDKNDYLKPDDVYYIIFTSGSTGTPKGVQITYRALNNFTRWAMSLEGNHKNKTYINQAPFSFDLSVMDLYMSLASESCLFALDKETQKDYGRLFSALGESNANVWVSTPSFADMCLADASFSENLLPNVELFLFCGETLTNKTADKLHSRFPKARIYNTYGPTESTVAVTEVEVTDEILTKYQSLPVGKAKPGTVIKIINDGKEAADGESGEIIIIGDTVSAGYFKNPTENERAFFTTETGERGYRTGDKGYLKDGLLFYEGRIDLQIKLHGYRMELEDVEENLMKVPNVEKAIVIPIYEDEKVKYLKAFCIYSGENENPRATQKIIRSQMAEFVPEYMIPRKIAFIDEIPMTTNGKADRKRLKEM